MAQVPRLYHNLLRESVLQARHVIIGRWCDMAQVARRRSLWLMPPPIPKGMRHDYLVSLAGAFWSAGLSEREVEMILWAGLELLATLDDFDPKREIPNIVKGLQKWEGATYSVGSLLRMLPERAAVKVTLGEIEQILGVVKTMGEVEAKERKVRKSKAADLQDIKAILWRHKWVVWRGALWQVASPKLLKVDLDLIHGLLKREGVEVGKETLKSYWADIMTDIPKDPLDGLVVTPSPTYGKVENMRGLWFSHRGDVYLVTSNGWRVFSRGQWPEGVYTLDLGMQAILPDWEGEIIHLLKYWEGITSRFEGNPKVALSMFLPVLFGQGDIGIILRGPAKSGKSTLLRAMAFLHLGRKPNTPSGSVNMRDIIAVLHRRQIAFFDEVNTFSIELQETLKRMITHDGAVMRALYTDFETVETELSGSAIFCTTNLEKLASDLRTRCFVWDLREKKGGLDETEILEFCRILWRKALAGAIKLYQQAAKLKSPPKGLLPQVRFRDWLSWAYRYAEVLGVADEFVTYVAKSKRAAHKGDKYEFLLDAILHPNFDPNKEYTIGDLIALTSLPVDDAKRIKSSINREGVRSDMIALALDAGYNLRIEKGRDDKDRKVRYIFIFSPIEASTSDHLQEILESLGINPAQKDDDDAPPDNTGEGGDVNKMGNAIQDETKTEMDMAKEKKSMPIQPEKRWDQAAIGFPTPPAPNAPRPNGDPKKAPPHSEWVYRAGTTPQDGGGSGGLFTAPQNGQPTTPSQPQPSAPPQNTAQDDEYPNDDELIEYIEERLKLHGQHQLSLETSIEWLRGFLLLHEGKMWGLGLKKSYHHIVNREIELQNAIKALGYDKLTPEKDPRLRMPASNGMQGSQKEETSILPKTNPSIV
jgi:hypothetical protein